MIDREKHADGGFVPEDFGIGRLFQYVRDAVIVANARTERIVLWNECAESLFGYSQDEALALPLHALVPESLKDLHRTGIARYQQTGSGKLVDDAGPVELKGLHKDGREIPIELTLTKIPETTSTGDRFALAIVRDIADRKLAERAALEQRDARIKRRQALELNDEIVQGLAVAKMAFEVDRHAHGLQALTETLKRAQALVSQLLGDISDAPPEAGDLVLGQSASMSSEQPPEDAGPEPQGG